MMTLKLAGNCVSRSPKSLLILKSKTTEVLLVADPANTAPVTVKFKKEAAAALFSSFPKSPVKLAPGDEPVKFVIKDTPMGLTKRAAAANFSDDKEAFARSLVFEYEPGLCTGGHHADFHVEC
jgi:hypothetical protein